MRNFEDKMDAYIQDQMSEVERNMFEKELSDDPFKKEQFEKHKAAIQMIKVASLKERLDQIEAAHRERKNSRETKKPRIIPIFSKPQLLGIAASLVILIVAAVWIFTNDTQSKSQLAFQKYYHKDPGLPTTMGVSKQVTMSQAMLYYKQNDYLNAKEAFLELIDETPSDTVRYYYAMTLIELDQYVDAEKYLTKTEFNNEGYQQRKEWYIAMLLLKQENKDEALKQLQTIANSSQHLYKNEAQKIIKELK